MNQPDVRIKLNRPRPVYEPGELLGFEFRVAGSALGDPTAVEVSIVWYTEGKGDEDLAVHFFDRVDRSGGGGDFCRPHAYSVALPNAPLSYDGAIVKIRWCVRVRVFLGRGRDFVTEEPFRLGHVPAATPVAR